eukprot:scaffold211796_cov39-Tisochrysis_lutea.AAC.2
MPVQTWRVVLSAVGDRTRRSRSVFAGSVWHARVQCFDIAEHEDIRARVVELRVSHRVLIARCTLDHLPKATDLSASGGFEGQAHGVGVNDGVLHTTVCNADRNLKRDYDARPQAVQIDVKHQTLIGGGTYGGHTLPTVGTSIIRSRSSGRQKAG